MPLAVLLIVDGFHVPPIPFVELAGKGGAGSPLHIGPIGLNVGVTRAFTVTDRIAVDAH